MSEETVLTPIAPEEGGMEPPKVNPVPVAAGSAPTVKLKPVIRKPMIRKPVIGGAKPVTLKPAAGTPPPPAAVPEAAASAAAAEVKKATSSLKAVTGAIPAQAVLRKTGIVAEGLLTPAQAQAAKTKTSRISLESAIGVAPAMKSAAPMKTIRLRRPTDLPPPSTAKPASTVAAPAPAPVPASAPAEVPAAPAADAVADIAPAPAPVDTSAETVAADADQAAKPKLAPVTVTQKKTLKLQRPGFKRPTVSGLRKPGATAPAPADAPAGVSDASAPAEMEPVADISTVADIPDLKPLSPAEVTADAKDTVAGAPAWLNVTTLLAAVAALVVMGLCTWTLYCEAAGPNSGPNDMASFHSDTDRRW